MNVNHNAAVCPAFLKGYCEEGNNCKLKHTRECQSYNKNGYCPDKLNGRCKLQHNKDSKHGKKIKKKSVDSNTSTDTDKIDLNPFIPNFIDSSESSSEEEFSGDNSDSEIDEDEDENSSESEHEEIPMPSFLKL